MENLYQITSNLVDLVKSIDTISNVYQGRVTYLNEGKADYSIAVIDLMNGDIDDNLITLRYRIYLLDRIATNQTNKINIYNWGMDCVRMIVSKLEDEFEDYNIGQVTFVEQDYNDLLAGCVFDVDISYPFILDC